MLRVQDGQRAGQLPAEITGFVGRRAELSRLVKLLGDSRLVTVTGTGGVGKTRFTLRAAALAAGRYRDGVFLAQLSGLRDPGLLGRTVATALGLPERGTRTGHDAVLERVRHRSILLILDNCEHLIDECAALAAAILAEAANVTVLATSRQPTDVPGEAVFTLAPLPVPADSVRAAEPGDAIELFAQRAATAVPGFAVTDSNAGDVARICRRLGGVPLAIELAAVRLRALPVRDLADRLDQKFQVLDTARRMAGPDRHQTLHNAIAWSYDLCSETEQSVWARLSVFAGSFDIASAEEVCADDNLPREEVTNAIIGLVDKSVVPRSDADGTRYRLLDTIREFGAARLAASGDLFAVRARHVAWYLDSARDFQRNFAATDQMARLTRLRRENANIRAALAYALDAPQEARRDQAAALAAALYAFWQISGYLGEGRHWLGKVLDRFPEPGRERAWALINSALLGAFQGNPSSVDEAMEGTRIATELGDEWLTAHGYLARNITLAFAGRYEESLADGTEAEHRMTDLGSDMGLLCLDGQMGLLLMFDGQFTRCLDRCQQGLRRLGDRDGERWLRSYFHGMSAMSLYHQEGREAESAAACARALPAKVEIGDLVGAALAIEVFAWLAADANRGERTAWLLGAADTLWRQTGSRLCSENAILRAANHKAADKAREAIGADRFDALFADGASRPLSLIVPRAVADADTLDERSPAFPGARRALGSGSARTRARSGDDAFRFDAQVPAARIAPSTAVPAPLTRREMEVARLVSTGLSNRQIAERLVISIRTVDTHVDHIFTKLGISSRLDLASILSQPASHN